jgi:hypothetical protein
MATTIDLNTFGREGEIKKTKGQIRAEMTADFKKMFGENAWFISDEDYTTKTYKIDWFVKCGRGALCVINCEDRKDKYDLDYNEMYWGSSEYNALLKKYELGMEWYDESVAYVFYDKDYTQ